MTIVAAYRIENTPVLVGDLLVTSPADNQGSLYLPTNPAAASSLPAHTGFRVSSLRRKVHIINSKLAVAWAGSLLAASMCVGKLYSLFHGRIAVKADIERALTGIREFSDEHLNVHLIGWVVEKGASFCFRWNSGYPAEVFYAPAHFEGSAEKLFNQFIQREVLSGAGEGIKSEEELAEFKLVSLIAWLLDRRAWGRC